MKLTPREKALLFRAMSLLKEGIKPSSYLQDELKTLERKLA